MLCEQRQERLCWTCLSGGEVLHQFLMREQKLLHGLLIHSSGRLVGLARYRFSFVVPDFNWSGGNYTDRMKEVLRKKSTSVSNVTYKHDFSNILRASNITVEVIGERVVLSLDFSPNQPRGEEHSHAYTDAENLKENFEEVLFIQMHREKWLEDGLRDAAEEARKPSVLEVECCFKDGSVRTMPASLKTDDHNFWFHRKGEPETSDTGEV